MSALFLIDIYAMSEKVSLLSIIEDITRGIKKSKDLG